MKQNKVAWTEPLGLRVVQQGAGPDVLLIAGLGDDSSVWDPQVSALESGFRVTRYDARGVAGPVTPPGPYRMRSLVADAVAVLDSAGIERAHIVGTSIGGVVAQQLAISHPQRVTSLTLSGTWTHADRALRALLSTWRWAAEHAGSVADVLQVSHSTSYGPAAWNSGAVDKRISVAEAAALRDGEHAWRSFRQAFTWTSWAAVEHDTRDALGAVTIPALIITGDQDRVLGERHARELAALLPSARLVTIGDAGHRPFDEEPARANDLLLAFLENGTTPSELAVHAAQRASDVPHAREVSSRVPA
jgi:pimeloyl-ACP methyl ester carboxylesterase